MYSLRRQTVKKLFLFFLIYLPVQYIFIGISGVLWSEPWPAFALPGFKNVPNTQNQTQVLKPYFYIQLDDSTGAEIEVEPSELFNGIQPSQLQGFIRTNFSQPKEFDRDVRQWFNRQITRMYPSVKAKTLKIRWKNVFYGQSEKRVVEISRENVRVVTIPFET